MGRPAQPEPAARPVGRRVVLGLLGLGVAGVVGGASFSRRLSEWLAPVELRDPTGLLSTLPLGPVFRFYSVTGGGRAAQNEKTYRLQVGGLVAQPATYRLDDLRALPQTSFTSDFHCVTGWVVPGVPLGRRPAVRAARPGGALVDGDGGAVPLVRRRLHREPDAWTTRAESHVIVALEMLGGPVSHDHGGPVRMYVDGQYGYKSTKWLSGIELTEDEVPGYWEHRGYDVDGTIRE